MKKTYGSAGGLNAQCFLLQSLQDVLIFYVLADQTMRSGSHPGTHSDIIKMISNQLNLTQDKVYLISFDPFEAFPAGHSLLPYLP